MISNSAQCIIQTPSSVIIGHPVIPTCHWAVGIGALRHRGIGHWGIGHWTLDIVTLCIGISAVPIRVIMPSCHHGITQLSIDSANVVRLLAIIQLFGV